MFKNFGIKMSIVKEARIDDTHYTKWPFTVNEAWLCRTRTKEIILRVDDKYYALNGSAKCNKKYLDIKKIVKPDYNALVISKIIELGLNLG